MLRIALVTLGILAGFGQPTAASDPPDSPCVACLRACHAQLVDCQNSRGTDCAKAAAACTKSCRSQPGCG